jgi:hypothetical protein
MPLIDDRGRVFGKVNLIDAIVALVMLGLIPLAYVAFLLFRVPVPNITSISPAQVVENQTGSLQVTGDGLRPFLRAKIGTFDTAFLVQSPTIGEIKLPPKLPAGTYDVALFDEGQELVRNPGALTVGASSSRLDMEAVGAFVDVAGTDTRLIPVGSTFGSVAKVLAVRSPEPAIQRVRLGPDLWTTTQVQGELRIPAIIALGCAVVTGDCKVGDQVAARGTTIALPSMQPPPDQKAPPSAGPTKFLIDEIFPSGTRAAFPAIATVRVRFVGEPEVLNVMHVGDVDLSGSAVTAPPDRAVLTQVGSDRQTLTALSNNSEGLLRRTVQLQQPVLAFTGTVRVRVVFTPSGWSYKERPVKVGAPFTFETLSGAMMGAVISMNVTQEEPAP